MVAVQSVFGEKIMTDLIYTRFVFIAQKKQNDMRYSADMNKYRKKIAKINFLNFL